MSLMKYQDVLILCKDKINEVMAPLRVREMRKKAELEVCKIDGQIAEYEQRIQQIASEYPINFDRLICCLDDLDLMTRRKEQFEKIIDDMFNNGTK